MRVSVETVLVDLKGKAIKDGTEDLTLRAVCVSALLGANKEQDGGLGKYKSFQLAKKIEESKEVILTSEEITGLKKLVDAFFGPLVVGQVYDLLEGTEDSKDSKKK